MKLGNTLEGGGLMVSFIKNSSTECIKRKLTYLYLLNALDIFFTFSLLKTGLFQEVNLLMVTIVEHALLSMLIKLLLPALLIIYILFKLESLDTAQLPLCNFFILIVLGIYTLITVSHMCYTFFFIYTLL